jgi:hypothetical protein
MMPLKYQKMRFMRGPLSDATKPALKSNSKLCETFEKERRQEFQADEQMAESCNAICSNKRAQKGIQD